MRSITQTRGRKNDDGITEETHVEKKQLVTETGIATGVVALNTATPIEYTLSVFYDNDENANQNTGTAQEVSLYVDYSWENIQ